MTAFGGSTSLGMADKLRFHPTIPQDLTDSIRRYDGISLELGNSLRAAFQTLFANIATNPELYAVVYDDIRIVRAKPFPYLSVVIQFPDGNGYPVAARPMTDKEKRRYRQWKIR